MKLDIRYIMNAVDKDKAEMLKTLSACVKMGRSGEPQTELDGRYKQSCSINTIHTHVVAYQRRAESGEFTPFPDA